MTVESKNGLTFARQVPAAEDDRLTYEVTRAATVERVTARIYRGAENTLQLQLKKFPASGSPVDLVDYADDDGGKDFIDGDDDTWEWDVSEPVEDGDTLVVDYENTDGSNAHNFRVGMDLDYQGGARRKLAQFTELFRGWL